MEKIHITATLINPYSVLDILFYSFCDLYSSIKIKQFISQCNCNKNKILTKAYQ